MRLGFQIPDFNYDGVPDDQLFDAVADQAVAAEESGWDTVLVMDHFYQLPMLGPPQNNMFECYSLLSALAVRTSKVTLSALVTGNTYRNPALLAKTVTTLDVISKGRAMLGIGCGWFELEHTAYGFDYGTFKTRFDRLDEAMEIIAPMVRGERVTFSGDYYTTVDAMNFPSPIRPTGIPIMVGGGGEKRTLPIAARYADESNLICGADEIAHKVSVLGQHCESIGRDPASIGVSWLVSAIVGETTDEATNKAAVLFADRDATWSALDEETKKALSQRMVIGTPADIRNRLAELKESGLTGVTINMPGSHDPDVIRALGEGLAGLF